MYFQTALPYSNTPPLPHTTRLKRNAPQAHAFSLLILAAIVRLRTPFRWDVHVIDLGGYRPPDLAPFQAGFGLQEIYGSNRHAYKLIRYL